MSTSTNMVAFPTSPAVEFYRNIIYACIPGQIDDLLLGRRTFGLLPKPPTLFG